jgi:replicative DNA helicase
MQEQMEEAGDDRLMLRSSCGLTGLLQAYARLQKLLQKYRPKLVVIDSLTGCYGWPGVRREQVGVCYAALLVDAQTNGEAFPACTILIIHHANKTGGFRGTSAIRDAVDETWSMQKPSDKPSWSSTGHNARIITIEKSRSGRGGHAACCCARRPI